MALVAGVDSSTQSCKVVIRDAETGRLVRTGAAPHPPGTEVAPEAWWVALQQAIRVAGGLDDVVALAVAGQQHGMVCLDADGRVVRDALLWNDLRAAQDALDLIAELPGGASAWAEATGSVPVASFTVTKLRWLARHEPDNAARTAAVCLPHDYLTWRLAGHGEAGGGLDGLVTDRGDASGTGYWSPAQGRYRRDLLELALGHDAHLPTVLGPHEAAGHTPAGIVLGPGTGDNAASALGLGAGSGDLIISIGTSGVSCAVSPHPTADPSGTVAGFADATGAYLPLCATINAARVLDSMGTLLGVDHDGLARLALAAPPGAEGVVLVPYFDGERTPNRPDATGALHGLQLATTSPANVARAAIEGLLCGLADAVDALAVCGVSVDRAVLVGGGSRSPAVRAIAPAILGLPVDVPPEAEHAVADGAARQAAWVLAGGGSGPPAWAEHDPIAAAKRYVAEPVLAVRARYAQARDLVLPR